MINVIIPQQIALIVSRKYTNLRRRQLRATGKAYPIAKMRQNIANALSINGGYVIPSDLKVPIIEEWKTKLYKVLHYGHWYFAVRLKQNCAGDTIAVVRDAKYEGDYHNDTMQTTPYESLKRNHIIQNESQLQTIIRESIKKMSHFI